MFQLVLIIIKLKGVMCPQCPLPWIHPGGGSGGGREAYNGVKRKVLILTKSHVNVLPCFYVSIQVS